MLNPAATAAWEVTLSNARALKGAACLGVVSQDEDGSRSSCIIIENTAATRVGVLKRSPQPPNFLISHVGIHKSHKLSFINGNLATYRTSYLSCPGIDIPSKPKSQPAEDQQHDNGYKKHCIPQQC